MEAPAGQAMDQGYLGMSTDGLPFTTWPMRRTRTSAFLPSSPAVGEMKRLLKVVRDRDRCGRPPSSNIEPGLLPFIDSGRLFGKTSRPPP